MTRFQGSGRIEIPNIAAINWIIPGVATTIIIIRIKTTRHHKTLRLRPFFLDPPLGILPNPTSLKYLNSLYITFQDQERICAARRWRDQPLLLTSSVLWEALPSFFWLMLVSLCVPHLVDERRCLCIWAVRVLRILCRFWGWSDGIS